MSLSVAEQFYIANHRDVPPKELAKTLSLPTALVRAAIKKLPAAPVAAKPDRLAKFDTHKGVVSMTPAQASDDDEIMRSPPKNLIANMPGIHIMDPSKPIR